MSVYILAFFTALLLVIFFTPSLIKVAELKNLTDEPDEERKLHKRKIPTIGGIIIFAAMIFALSLWLSISFTDDAFVFAERFKDYTLIVTTTLVLFFVGVKDDIIGTAPIKKLIAHILVAMVIVLMANIRIKSLHGIFGVYDIPLWASIFISIFTIIVVINAFNLIDGVDGLAAGIGFIGSVVFGLWFSLIHEVVMATLAFSLAGSLLGFLYYNFSPAKIFMGDSGSLTIGLVMSILALKMVDLDPPSLISPLSEICKPLLAIAILVYPLTDTLRIFIYRTLKGTSPFAADRNHIHHRLQDAGFSHRQVSSLLYFMNIAIVLLVIFSYRLKPTIALILLLAAIVALIQIPFLISRRIQNKS
jgi:UDP-N-acetylmuramyl pentapeptide phosphotransferase/UDP-N-acetylglucosamine-1-phosphate transferase